MRQISIEFVVLMLFFIIPITNLEIYKTLETKNHYFTRIREIRSNKIKHKNEKPLVVNIKEVTVYDTINKTVFTKDFEEYMVEVLIGEMPASFEFEALKAQCVAIRSYVLDKILNCPNIEEHFGASVCTNPGHCKAWRSIKNAKNLWGQEWIEKYLPKVKKAVKETEGQYMVHGNKIVKAFFFSMSSGKTEVPEEVWCEALPYLKSVKSPYEENLPNFRVTKNVTENEFLNKLKELKEDFNLDEKFVGKIERTSGGSIKKIEIGNSTFRGESVRKAFSLRSANFTIEKNNNNITFETIGFGHGVGMSQYGANEYAKRGMKYIDILKHYYTDVEIQKINQS